MFPVIGSCVLFGLYLLFKFFSKEYINMLLTAYFLLLGFVSLSKTISSLISILTRSKTILGQFTIPKVPFVLESMILSFLINIDIHCIEPFVVKFGVHDILAWIISVVLIYLYVTTKVCNIFFLTLANN